MIKRPLAFLASVVFTIWSVLYPAQEVKAAIPALILVDAAVTLAEGIILRSAASSTILRVGVAANDASFAVQTSGIISTAVSFLGLSGIIAAGNVQKYQIPVTPSDEEEEGMPFGAPTGAQGAYNNPWLYTEPWFRINVMQGGDVCKVQAYESNDGFSHSMPAGLYTISGFIAACNDALAYSLPFYSVTLEITQSVEKVERYIGNQSFYVLLPSIRLVGANKTVNYNTGGANFQSYAQELKDGIKRFVHDGLNGLKPDPSDPDWTEQEKNAAASTPGGAYVFKDAAGNRIDVYKENGVLRVNSLTALTPSSVKYRQLALSSTNGLLDSVQEQDYQNKTVDTFYGSGGTLPDPGTGTGTGSWPSDYSRAGEAGAAANAINIALGAKLDALTATSPAPSDPTYADDWTDFAPAFSSLLGWSLPGHGSQCPAPSFSAFNQTFIVDSHCVLAANHWGALQNSMFVVWTIAALFLVLRA